MLRKLHQVVLFHNLLFLVLTDPILEGSAWILDLEEEKSLEH